MGRIEFMDRPLGALPGRRPGFGALRESQAREALARWEDDGGRVRDRPWRVSPRPLPSTARNRAQSATAR
jgi:hypothetical protein